MKDTTLRYKLYEAALEAGISSDQYHSLMSEEGGVLAWVKDALAGVSAGKELAGDLKGMFANKKNQVLYRQATETIKKTVEDLFKAGAAAGVDKDALRDWLVKGIENVTRDAAASAPAADKKGGEAGEVKPGTPVKMPKDPSAPATSTPEGQALINVGAQVAKTDPAAAAEEASKSQKSFKELAQEIVKNAADASKQKPEDVKKVFNYMLQKGYLQALQAESRRHLPARYSDIVSVSRNVRITKESISTARRWQVLAGIPGSGPLLEADLSKDAAKLLPDVEKAVEDDPKNKKLLAAVLDAIKNDEEPDEGDFNLARNIVSNKMQPGVGAQFFHELEKTMKNSMKAGAAASKAKIKDLEGKAASLADELKNDREMFDTFMKKMAGELGINPEELKDKFKKGDAKEVLAAAMAKKPEAVEKAAEAAGASTAPSGQKSSGGGDSEELTDIVKGTGLDKKIVEPIYNVLRPKK